MENRPFFKCGLLGLTVIAMSIVLMFVLPSGPEVPAMPEGFVTPIIAYEFVRTPTEVELIFGADDSPERTTLALAMDLGNKMDYGYMVLYSSFLLFFSLLCVKETGRRLFYVPAGLSIVALAGDALENIQLLAITSKLSSMDIAGELVALQWFTWVKWGSLAVIFLLLAPYFFRGGKFAMTISGFGLATFIAGLAAFVHRSALNEMFAALTAVMFLLMIVYCFVHKRV